MKLKSLAERIRTRRFELGLSQDALSLQANTERSTIQNLERGVTKHPSLKTIYELAGALNTRLYYFFPTEILRNLPPADRHYHELLEFLHTEEDLILVKELKRLFSIFVAQIKLRRAGASPHLFYLEV